MASNDNVRIFITGDASGVAPAVEQTESALGGIGPILEQINANVQVLVTQMRAGFTQGAADAKKLAAGLEEAKIASGGAGAGIAAMVAKVHEGAESVRTFQMRAKEFAEVYVAMFAVEQIAEFINKMGEAAEKVQHLSQQFGMSVAEVQKLQGVATATGIPIDALTKGLAFLDRNLANADGGSKRLKGTMDQVGISFNDGRSQMEKLAVVADKFKNMDDGPKKVALAMQLFGRSGRELIPVLNLGRDGIEQLNAKMEEYGVVNEAAVEKGVVLAENVNETKLGFMGLENVLTDALAPALTVLVQGVNDLIQAFVASYQSGGIIYVIFQSIAAVIEIVVDVFKMLGSVFAEVWAAIVDILSDLWHDFEDVFGASVPKNVNVSRQILNVFKDTCIIVGEAIKAFIDEASLGFRVLAQVVVTAGKVMYDAITLHWGSIAGDWQAGMNRLVNIVHEGANKIVADGQRMADAIAAAAKGEALDSAKGGVKLPKAGGDFNFNPAAGGGKQKKPKDDLVQKLDEELETKITAWNKEQVAQGTAQEYSLQSIADFWNKALARTNLSAKDRLEIQRKYNAAERAVQNEAFDAKMEGFKRELAEADKNDQTKLAILQREAAATKAFYGENSKEARAADEAVYQQQKRAAEQRLQLTQDTLKHLATMEKVSVEDRQKAAEAEESLGLISKGKLLQQEKQFETELYKIDRAGLEQRLAVVNKDKDPALWNSLFHQIEELDRQHQSRLTQIDRAAVAERTKIERQAISSVSQNWGQNIGKMLTMQESFSAGVKDMWQGLVSAIGNAIGQIIEQWLEEQLAALILGKSQTQATNAASVASYAGVAGAAGVASWAGAPWPIDAGAPAFGASMASTALGFMGLASFDVGAWDLSRDQMAMVHQGEMIIPASLAGGMRELFKVAGNDNNSTKAPAQHGGDQHFHFAPTLIGEHPTWNSMMNRSERDARRWFKRQAANGAKVA
jgi:hypothetical protein